MLLIASIFTTSCNQKPSDKTLDSNQADLSTLEKEIELLESRQSSSSFVTELPAIEQAKLKLLQDTTLIRAQELFADTPIGTEQFKAAVYNLVAIGYKSKTKTKTKTLLVLILAVLLGVMLGGLVLFMRNILIKKN